jgi:hypothetical protein
MVPPIEQAKARHEMLARAAHALRVCLLQRSDGISTKELLRCTATPYWRPHPLPMAMAAGPCHLDVW